MGIYVTFQTIETVRKSGVAVEPAIIAFMYKGAIEKIATGPPLYVTNALLVSACTTSLQSKIDAENKTQ